MKRDKMRTETFSFHNWLVLVLSGSVALGVCILLFSFLGNPLLSPQAIWIPGSMEHDLFFFARLPRVCLAAMVGAGLSASGVTFQALLRNPLADPYILGVSGGSALGGVVALVLGLGFHFVTLTAFAFGLATLFLVYFMAQVEGQLESHSLLLTGVIFNAFAFALILLINSVVNMGQLQQIFYLLVGSLEAQEWSSLFWVGGLTLVGLILLFFNAGAMNLVALGEESSAQLGLDGRKLRKILFLASSLIVGASVSLVGLIGFVGLCVPHALRLFLGPDHRLLLPASVFGGGIFLVICDFLARVLFSGAGFQTQLPVGVVTAVIGAPIFVYLLKRGLA